MPMGHGLFITLKQEVILDRIKYEYMKVEINKDERKKIKIEAVKAGTTVQKLLGSIVRQYLSQRSF
tara:strand:+ start:311 stop:508 length:198 start_codon:yes stop_codon:yes gene_type:complete